MKIFAIVLTFMLVFDLICDFFAEDGELRINLTDVFALIFIYLHFAG